MASTSTSAVAPELDAALTGIPSPFRERLIQKYIELRSAYSEATFDAAGLRAGAFAETLLRFLQHWITGTHTPFGKRLPQFNEECLRLERQPAKPSDDGLRVIVPRGLSFLYTLRNKRGIGHVGGDVEANEIDAATCVRIADWCMCELIRVFHALSIEEAQGILDAIATRSLPSVWAVNGKKRILGADLDYRSQVLVLLHASADGSALVEDLYEWIEPPDLSKFRSRVLKPLHQARLIEYDPDSQTATISPTGVARAEAVLKSLDAA